MTIVNLYQYGVSPNIERTTVPKSQSDKPYMVRLLADNDMTLKHKTGNIETSCIDVSFDDINNWEEIELPIKTEEEEFLWQQKSI